MNVGPAEGDVLGTVLDKGENKQLYITIEISKESYLGFQEGVLVGRAVDGVDVGSPGRGVGKAVGKAVGTTLGAAVGISVLTVTTFLTRLPEHSAT